MYHYAERDGTSLIEKVKKTHDGRRELLLCAYMKKKLV